MAKDALSKAEAIWEGDLVHGKGSFSLASGAAGPLPDYLGRHAWSGCPAAPAPRR